MSFSWLTNEIGTINTAYHFLLFDSLTGKTKNHRFRRFLWNFLNSKTFELIFKPYYAVNKIWGWFLYNCSNSNSTKNDSSIIWQFMFHYSCCRFMKSITSFPKKDITNDIHYNHYLNKFIASKFIANYTKIIHAEINDF